MKFASHLGLLKLYLLHCNFLTAIHVFFLVFYICFMSDFFVYFASACRVLEILKMENMMNIQL